MLGPEEAQEYAGHCVDTGKQVDHVSPFITECSCDLGTHDHDRRVGRACDYRLQDQQQARPSFLQNASYVLGLASPMYFVEF